MLNVLAGNQKDSTKERRENLMENYCSVLMGVGIA